ncbi:DUF938 domain-containing protein [uncultured Shimia sp.]|uniref:DUF938 domain-containing protein n=1 Tax=uncultured Shimia sp. TaxID=573152 RepID=UPI00262E385B|nr:DUF938 domain-containing protein [uncultured Shimia sp.]
MAGPRELPETASVAHSADGGRLFAPSAARNTDAIVTLAAEVAPSGGQALEIASGTGQHIVALAKALPHLHWQPSEVDPERRASIDNYVAHAQLENLATAVELDATNPGWSATYCGQSFILLVNLLHLISDREARTLISEAAAALAPGGVLMIYGPFMRDTDLTSEGDAAFHASLKEKDPEIGYKSDFDVLDWGQSQWLDYLDMVEMPANNLAILFQKAA